MAFTFGAKITQALSRHVDLGELDIRIDNAVEPLYRPHRDSFSFDGKQSVNFDSLSFIEIPGIDIDLAAVAWVLHHEYAARCRPEPLRRACAYVQATFKSGTMFFWKIFSLNHAQRLVGGRGACDRPPDCAQRSSATTSNRMPISTTWSTISRRLPVTFPAAVALVQFGVNGNGTSNDTRSPLTRRVASSLREV